MRSDNGLFYASDFYQYDGVKLLDIFPGSTTQSFEIEAEGEWSIEIYPLQSEFFNERSLNAPGIYQGNNDDVLFINGGEYQISVEGNSANTNFIIWTHGEFGESYFMNFDLILNVSEPYDGIIDLPEWVRILEIEAVGPWTIEINNR